MKKNIASLGLVIIVIATLGGCASVKVQGRHSAVSGMTTDVIGAVDAANRYESNREWSEAVMAGRAHPAQMGGLGRANNDYNFFGFGGFNTQPTGPVVPTAQVPAVPAKVTPPPAQPQSANAPCTNCVTREEFTAVAENADIARTTADKADAKATSGLKILKGMRPSEEADDSSK